MNPLRNIKNVTQKLWFLGAARMILSEFAVFVRSILRSTVIRIHLVSSEPRLDPVFCTTSTIRTLVLQVCGPNVLIDACAAYRSPWICPWEN